MHLEIFVDRRRKHPYVYGLFPETFRENGKMCHRTRGRVTGLSLEQLEAMRDFVRQGCPKSEEPRSPSSPPPTTKKSRSAISSPLRTRVPNPVPTPVKPKTDLRKMATKDSHQSIGEIAP